MSKNGYVWVNKNLESRINRKPNWKRIKTNVDLRLVFRFLRMSRTKAKAYMKRFPEVKKLTTFDLLFITLINRVKEEEIFN